MLFFGLLFGVLASITYIYPLFLKQQLGFISLRPIHVSFILFWILLGATGCVYIGLKIHEGYTKIIKLATLQWMMWIIAVVGIITSYFNKRFAGREYWEFSPAWAIFIVFAWILFLINFIYICKKVKKWPVYIWMWFTGIVFFLFAFIENYLWILPFLRNHFVLDTTIQWKANGTLVGAWNQLLYGTAFYMMEKISNTKNIGKSKWAFSMFFLGLINLMFNWGHHIYTLPTQMYIKYVGYVVSMTEWIFFIKIIYNWKSTLNKAKRNYHFFPYRFLIAADIWVFINLGHAIIMSIPAINIYTHGTHITVAHAMGTTIGINTMIILAACCEFIVQNKDSFNSKYLKINFWILQLSLFIFWLSLNIAGIQKGIWQKSSHQSSFSAMMETLRPFFNIFVFAGFFIFISLGTFAFILIKHSISYKCKQ